VDVSVVKARLRGDSSSGKWEMSAVRRMDANGVDRAAIIPANMKNPTGRR